MNLEVDEEKKAEIANVITSPDSPVGIDAKKTHIIIINKLVEIEKRLEELEKLHWTLLITWLYQICNVRPGL